MADVLPLLNSYNVICKEIGVAEQMGTNNLFPFMARGGVSVSYLDKVIESGIYSMNDPTNTIMGWTAYGTIIVFNDKRKGFISQLFIHAQTLMCFRTSSNNGSTWEDWKIITVS